MSGLRTDMSDGKWICPTKHDFMLRKSRPGDKTISLGASKTL
jgi:hypothetical protein